MADLVDETWVTVPVQSSLTEYVPVNVEATEQFSGRRSNVHCLNQDCATSHMKTFNSAPRPTSFLIWRLREATAWVWSRFLVCSLERLRIVSQLLPLILDQRVHTSTSSPPSGRTRPIQDDHLYIRPCGLYRLV